MKKPVEKANFTAWFVLQGIIAAMHSLNVKDSHSNASILALRLLLAKSVAKQRFLSWLVAQLPYVLQYRIGQFVTDKGRLRHFYLRKEAIAKEVLDALSLGHIKQMVVLGSGLDVLSLAIATQFPHVHFIEVDVASTQEFKQSVYQSNNIALPENIDLLVGDLRDPLKDVMGESKLFTANVPTLWLAEGLLYFLPEASVKKLFEETKSISAENSRFIFTSISTIQVGEGLAQIIQKLYLSKEKSPFRWAIHPDHIGNYLAPIGYRIIKHISYQHLHEQYITLPYTKPRLDEGITVASL